jgi:hypothetical protein
MLGNVLPVYVNVELQDMHPNTYATYALYRQSHDNNGHVDEL